MSSTPTPSIKHLQPLALALMAAFGVHTAAHAQETDWPRTFSGQPDFDFTRSEVLTEHARQVAEEGASEITPATLADVLQNIVLTPLNIPSEENNSESGLDNAFLATLPTLQQPEAELPSAAAADTTLDLSAFKAELKRDVERALTALQPDPTLVPLRKELQRVVVQAVVTSPQKYVTINGRRFAEGDRFALPVTVTLTQSRLEELLTKRLPPAETLPADLHQSYQTVLNDVLAEAETERRKNSAAFSRNTQVDVRILTIAPRRVTLEVLGQTFDVGLNYAL